MAAKANIGIAQVIPVAVGGSAGLSGGGASNPSSYGGAAGGGMGQAGTFNPNIGQPQQGTRAAPSDARFRSFAERYMVARAHLFRTTASEHVEDQWLCVMDAKRAYAMISRVGQNINPEDGAL